MSIECVATISPAQSNFDGTSTNEARWTALLNRTEAFTPDGSPDAFFYGVTSTGVVCRPGCASRRPSRENTRFFDTLHAALRAGFRPCLRCHPDGVAPEAELAARVERSRLYIEQHLEEGAVPLARLAEVAGLSPFHLQRSFRAVLGVSPAEYGRRLRAERFAKALASGAEDVTSATYAAGFGSASRVYAKSNSLGMSPVTRRRGGAGETIQYSTVDSPLGRMLVATTGRGVCSIAFAATDAALLDELRGRFPAAALVEDDAALGDNVRAVFGGLAESRAAMALPMDVRATAFQARVWKALQEIPPGETRTYAQVAAAVGQPTAARAVARACASNPLAIAVPCHRVVGSDGSLTGYRWGKERKAQLLAMESKRR